MNLKYFQYTKCVQNVWETETVNTKTEINSKWNVNLLQYCPLDI